ncbi:MAG: copper-translocating P-type ATPase [Odoribacteraceae bacterium]|jgi:Cu2+-exporting ATPase|nr:copper-translocating P-type ATPase [Odoribacteraceae bacterium]
MREHFRITGAGCAACAIAIEQALRAIDGVIEARVALADASLFVRYDPARVAPAAIARAVAAAGYGLQPLDSPDDPPPVSRRRALLAILLAAPVLVTGMGFMHWPPGQWIMLALTLAVIIFPGRTIFLGAARRLRRGKIDMDALVAASAGVAFLFSLVLTLRPRLLLLPGAHLYYEAAATVIALVLLGRYIENRARAATNAAVRLLVEMQPPTVLRVDPDGKETEIPADDARPGDLLSVKPGERMPADGTVANGNSFVDESAITGEPLPVEKTTGDPLYAGSLNGQGYLLLRVDKEQTDSLLSRVIRATREARGSKIPVQRLVDRLAAVFVPVVAASSLLTFLVWIIAAGIDALPLALLASISVLVIACPCALGLATPLAIAVAIGKGAARQLLFRDAACLEQLNGADSIVFDKTGTITRGLPAVTTLHWYAPDPPATVLLALERLSTHPLAGAVIRALEARGVADRVDVSSFEALPGLGIRGHADGVDYIVGNERLLACHRVPLPAAVVAARETLEARGETLLYFARVTDDEGQLLAMISAADEPRESAAPAVQLLLDRGLDVYLLTGDNERAATSVAARVGVTRVSAGLMPGDKERFVRELQEQGHRVAVVGDGVNDAGALARADVGVAMGKGAGAAIETAGVTLITTDLRAVDAAIRLSRQTLATIRQNLFWASVYNLLAIPVAAGVLYPINGFLLDPMIAAAAMTCSSLSVVLNSARLARKPL